MWHSLKRRGLHNSQTLPDYVFLSFILGVAQFDCKRFFVWLRLSLWSIFVFTSRLPKRIRDSVGHIPREIKDGRRSAISRCRW